MTTLTRVDKPEVDVGVVRRRRSLITRRNAPYIFLLPALITFLVFKAYPILASAWISLTTGAGSMRRFDGLANYQRLIHDPLFWTALKNTATILVVQVPVMLILSMLLASGLNAAYTKLRGVWRLGAFMPSITGLVATGIIFSFLLDKDGGAINWLLTSIGIPKVNWLGNPIMAKLSIALLITWHNTGYNAVIYLAGMQGVPAELHEAAKVDGAGRFHRFLAVTLPHLRPIVLFTVVLSTIGTLQLFDEPYVLTHGGPDNATITVAMYLYDNAFSYFDFGYASAVAYVLTLLVVILGVVQMKLMGERE